MVSVWYVFNLKYISCDFSFFSFIYLFIFYIHLFIFFVCVSERLLSATFTWIIIFFCLNFSGWDTWNVTLQTSNLKQTLTIKNISTIFLLKSMSSNTIQAFNVFECYYMSAIFTLSILLQHLMWAIFPDKSRTTVCWT